MKKNRAGANALLNIADRLRRQATKAENRATWREKTAALFTGLTVEDREFSLSLLRAAQVQRDAGTMTEDQALHLIFCSAEMLAKDAIMTDPTLQTIHDQLDAIRKREGLSDDEYWRTDDPDAPADYCTLAEQWDRRADQIIVSILRRHEENDIADLFLNDRQTFERRSEAGRQRMAVNL